MVDLPAGGSVTYTLEITVGASFANPVFTEEGIKATRFTLPRADALAPGDYSWRVRAVDSAGNVGLFSQPFTFTVAPDEVPQAAPKLLSPPDQSTVGVATPTFEWERVTAEDRGMTYNLEIGIGDSFDNLAFTVDGIEATRLTLASDDALPEGDYVWRVQAVDSAGSASRSRAYIS